MDIKEEAEKFVYDVIALHEKHYGRLYPTMDGRKERTQVKYAKECALMIIDLIKNNQRPDVDFLVWELIKKQIEIDF